MQLPRRAKVGCEMMGGRRFRMNRDARHEKGGRERRESRSIVLSRQLAHLSSLSPLFRTGLIHDNFSSFFSSFLETNHKAHNIMIIPIFKNLQRSMASAAAVGRLVSLVYVFCVATAVRSTLCGSTF